jgi:hypothetical protein
MMKRINFFKVLIAISFYFLMSDILFAQAPVPPPNGPCGGPIDGGLSILLFLAGSYGGKMIYNAFKKRQKE